jgi:hypothetical protein
VPHNEHKGQGGFGRPSIMSPGAMNSKQLMQLRDPTISGKTQVPCETRHHGNSINRGHDHEISFPSRTPEL